MNSKSSRMSRRAFVGLLSASAALAVAACGVGETAADPDRLKAGIETAGSSRAGGGPSAELAGGPPFQEEPIPRIVNPVPPTPEGQKPRVCDICKHRNNCGDDYHLPKCLPAHEVQHWSITVLPARPQGPRVDRSTESQYKKEHQKEQPQPASAPAYFFISSWEYVL